MRHTVLQVLILLLCITGLSARPVIGQSEDEAPVITPENATQLEVLSTIESSYLGELQWSPDEKWVAIGTSPQGVKLYQVDDLTAPPLELAGSTDVMFHPDSLHVVSGGAVWNIETQGTVFEFGDVARRLFSPDGRYLITVALHIGRTDFTFYEMPTGNIHQTFSVETSHRFHHIEFSEDNNRFALIFLTPHAFSTMAYVENQDTSFIEVRETATATHISTLVGDYPEFSIAFANDGQYLAAVNTQYDLFALPSKVIIWDIMQGNRIVEYDTYDRETKFSPDKKWLLVNEVSIPYLIALDTTQIQPLAVEHRTEVNNNLSNAIKFSPDGRYLALPFSKVLGGDEVTENGILLWDLATLNYERREPSIKLMIDNAVNMYSIKYDFSPDSQLLAMTTNEETLIWDIELQQIQTTIPDTRQITFTADSAYAMFSGYDVYDVASGIQISENTAGGTLSPSRRQVASRTTDSLRVVDLFSTDDTALPILTDYLGKVDMIHGAGGYAIFSDATLSVVDLQTQNHLLHIAPDPYRYMPSDDGSRLVVAEQAHGTQRDVMLSLYNLEDTSTIPITFDGEYVGASIQNITLSSDNQYLFVTEIDNESRMSHLRLSDATTGNIIADWERDTRSFDMRSSFSPDNNYLLLMESTNIPDAEIGHQMVVNVWDVDALRSGETEPQLILNLGRSAYDSDLHFNLDGSQLLLMVDAADRGDGRVLHNYHLMFFDWAALLNNEGEILLEDVDFQSFRELHSPAFNPNTHLILTVSDIWDRELGSHVSSLNLLDVEAGEIIVTLEGYSNGVISPDGRLLAALSRGGDMVLWDMATLAEGDVVPLISFESRGVNTIMFSANGEHIYQQTAYGVKILGIIP